MEKNTKCCDVCETRYVDSFAVTCSDENCPCHQEPNGVGRILEKLSKFEGNVDGATPYQRIKELVTESYQAGVIQGLSQNGNITYEPPEEQSYRRGMEAGVSAERERAKEIIKGMPESFAEVKDWTGEKPLHFIKQQLLSDLLREEK